MTRALGDFWSQTAKGEYSVSPVPDVFHRTISSNDCFLISATDGLWDVMSAEEVALHVFKFFQHLQKFGGPAVPCNSHTLSAKKYHCHQCVSEHLLCEAKQRWTARSSDNITIAYTHFHPYYTCPCRYDSSPSVSAKGMLLSASQASEAPVSNVNPGTSGLLRSDTNDLGNEAAAVPEAEHSGPLSPASILPGINESQLDPINSPKQERSHSFQQEHVTLNPLYGKRKLEVLLRGESKANVAHKRLLSAS